MVVGFGSPFKRWKKFFFFLWKFVRFKLGSGREIRFWEDRWLGENPLNESFKFLHSLALDPFDRVVDLFDMVGNIWVPRLHKNLNDWELGGVVGLLTLLDGIRLDPTLHDGWEWVISIKSRSTPKSLYLEISTDRSLSFPHKGIWIPSIPSKVSFFIWNAFLD